MEFVIQAGLENASESRNHFFFECSYSVQLWKSLTTGIMGSAFTSSWADIMQLIAEGRNMDRKKWFCLRKCFKEDDRKRYQKQVELVEIQASEGDGGWIAILVWNQNMIVLHIIRAKCLVFFINQGQQSSCTKNFFF